MDKEQLIQFWYVYNTHLVHIIDSIPENKLQNKCTTKEGNLVTLSFLIADYIAHLEHHLNQIFSEI